MGGLFGSTPSPPPIMPPAKQPVPDDQAAKEAARQAQMDILGQQGRASTNLSGDTASKSNSASGSDGGTVLGGAST